MGLWWCSWACLDTGNEGSSISGGFPRRAHPPINGEKWSEMGEMDVQMDVQNGGNGGPNGCPNGHPNGGEWKAIQMGEMEDHGQVGR